MRNSTTIVIGGGPGGCATALYLARFCHEVILIDAGKEIPGRTSWALDMQNILGFADPIAGPEFLATSHAQLKACGVTIIKGTVSEVRRLRGSSFRVTVGKKKLEAHFVVVAVGVQDILPNIPEAESYLGKSLFPCPMCNWYQTRNNDIALISNDDTGIITALGFKQMNPKGMVTVVSDRPHPHFSPAMKAKATLHKIAVMESPVVEIKGSPEKVEGLVLSDSTEIKAGVIFTRLGVKRHDTFLDRKSIPLQRDTEGYIEVDFKTFESSVPNLFAVGPCNTGPDQVTVAAAQGIQAATAIHLRILN